MYIQESWYVAAFAEEVTRVPLRRTLLDESVVLYRTEAGSAVALSDVCPHRPRNRDATHDTDKRLNGCNGLGVPFIDPRDRNDHSLLLDLYA
jgi:nitrite reductase/ring-hydroxylating ferredoxin subunit